MATINHSAGADIIVPSSNGTTYRGLAGDDTYIISNSIVANAAITIVDTSGSNKIQLVDGLSITSSKFAADAVQLTLSNGAVVTINGASNFTYDVGGNATSGTSGTSNTLAAFAASMGVATLPSSGSTDGSANVTVSGSAVSSTASPTYTVTKSASKVDEGSDVTFTITSSSAVTADTTFSWSAMGSTNGATVTAASNSDISVLSGTATIASGGTSTTFTVGAVSDSTVEGLEGMQVSVFDSNAAAVGTGIVLIDNTGSAATTQAFIGTTGVNNFTGGSGNDSFDFSTAATWQDIDALDGAGGTDTLTVSYAATATLKPDLENIENVIITNSAAATNTLTINAVDTASGYSSITNLGSTGHVTINNLVALPTLVTLNNSSDTLTLDFEAAALAGTADNLSVTISGTASAATGLTLTGDGTGDIETLTLNSTAQANTLATLTTADIDVAKLVVTGDQNLTITGALAGEIVEVDASAATGALTLSAAPGVTAGIKITGGAGNDSLKGTAAGTDTLDGGAGDDTFTLTGLNALDAVDGGAGSDTVSVDMAITSATQLGGLSNVETMTFTGDNAIALAANTSATTFNFVDTSDQVLTIDEGYTAATSVVLATYLGGDTTNPADGFVNLANVTSTVTANTLGLDTELTLTGGTGTDTLQLYLGGNADETLVNSVSGFENFTILDNPVGNTATTLTFGAYAPGTAKHITIDASSLDALDVASFVIDASSVAADATGASKKITYTDGANAGKITLGNNADTATMGTGNDTVVGTAGANTISMGAGNDSVTAGTGAENITGGDGNDTINMGGNLTALDTIDGGAGTDTLITTATIASATILGGMSNVEVLSATGATTITLAANISATTFNFAGTGNQVLNLSAGYTDTVTVILTGDGGGDSVQNSGVLKANTTLTVKADFTDITAATSLAGGTGTDTLELRQTNGTATVDGDITGFDAVTITDKAGDNSSDVTLTMTSYATAATIDASALDAGEDDTLTLTSGTAAFTIKGGDGVSTIVGGNLGDTITGNGGADVINGGTGLDNISGGAANDSITASTEAAFSTTLGTDTVDGGTGTDTLTFSAAATLSTAETVNVSNVEVLALTTGSTLTVNDAFLAANPGLVIQPGATSTIKASVATGDSLTTALSVKANAAGNLSILGGTGDDSFTFYATESLTVLDSINGGTGEDTIYIDINDGGAYVGANTSAVLDVNVTGIEKVVVADGGLDDGGGSGTVITTTITVNAANTLTALTIDGSSLDTHPTTLSGGERLTATASAASATELMTLIGGGFSDSLTGGAGIDTITGNAGADTLIGGAGNDIISGGAGADAITPGTGLDSATGGAGNDTFTVSTFTDFKTSGGAETLDGGAGTDTITFTEAAALTLTAPELEAIVGIETIDAADTIAGNQTTITLGNGFFTSNGSSTITIDGNDADNSTSDHKIDLSAVSNGAVTFYPNDTSTAANDTLLGGSGDDVWMVVGTAAASLEATDTFTGNAGTDQFTIVNTTAITAVIDFSLVTGVEKAVVLYNSTGAVDIDLGAITALEAEPATFIVDGSAVISSTGTLKFNKTETETNLTTKFTITGGLNNDTLYGAGGADTIVTGAGVNTAGGNGGADTITGGSGIDTIAGDAGADVITAAGGADVITGGSGNDTINAGDGADTVTPGSGKDTITLGSGIDTIIYTVSTESAGSTYDTITDFVSGALGDNIRLTHTFPTTQNGTFTMTDRGDTASAGTVAGVMGNVAGDAAFITDEAAIAIDLNADGIVNANDFKVAITGHTTLSIDDIDMYLTTTEASTITTAGGNDSITGATTVAHTIYTYSGNDTITLVGDADDTVWGGNGSDVIDLGAVAGSDVLYLNAGVGKTKVTGFLIATDILHLNMDLTTATTASGGNLVIANPTAAAPVTDAAYNFTAGMTTTTTDLVELEAGDTLNRNGGNLFTDYTNDTAIELFKIMSADAANTIGSITVDVAGDQFYILAYDTDTQGAYLYHANSAAVLSDTSVTVNEVSFVAFFVAAVDDVLGATAATTLALDFTTINVAY